EPVGFVALVVEPHVCRDVAARLPRLALRFGHVRVPDHDDADAGVLTGRVPVRQGEVIPPHPPAVTARASAAAARARRPRGRRTTVIGTPPTSPSVPHWGAHTGHDKRDRADRGG